MTTIAWDGITIAHDSQATAGNVVLSNQRKSFFIDREDGLSIMGEQAVLMVSSGMAGDERYARHFMRNCNDDCIMELEEELQFCVWVFTKKGNCYAIQKVEGTKMPAVYAVVPPSAEGCGKPFALTAMYLGQTAEQAVITTSVLDAFTDANVKTYQFKYGEVMK